jgi:hypothetical protein
MKIPDGKVGQYDGAGEDPLKNKARGEPNKESLELGLL